MQAKLSSSFRAGKTLTVPENHIIMEMELLKSSSPQGHWNKRFSHKALEKRRLREPLIPERSLWTGGDWALVPGEERQDKGKQPQAALWEVQDGYQEIILTGIVVKHSLEQGSGGIPIPK